MTRKLSVTLILVLLASLFVATPASAAKSYYAERFDVQIDIQENGSAIVTETVEFRFSGDPFTFAFREVSAAETDGLIFLDASMDGVPMPLGTEAGQVEVEAGNPLKVTWHFPPTSDAAHVFTVRYRAEGVIRKGDADTLIWRAVPEDHDYSISNSTIILTYPPKATLLGQPTLDWNHDSRWEGDRIILTASGLAEDEDLILTASSVTPGTSGGYASWAETNGVTGGPDGSSVLWSWPSSLLTETAGSQSPALPSVPARSSSCTTRASSTPCA